MDGEGDEMFQRMTRLGGKQGEDLNLIVLVRSRAEACRSRHTSFGMLERAWGMVPEALQCMQKAIQNVHLFSSMEGNSRSADFPSSLSYPSSVKSCIKLAKVSRALCFANGNSNLAIRTMACAVSRFRKDELSISVCALSMCNRASL